MREELSRTAMLLGEEAIGRLKAARVAVFGLGGVGGFAAEALARSGVGALDLIDRDTVSLSNINRQILALHSTVGMPKAEAAAARIRDISPECSVRTFQTFFLPETAGQFDFREYDYVIDAIDTVSGKIALSLKAKSAGTAIISAMGAGNKLDPTAFRVSDLKKTRICPLCRVMRKELGRRGVTHLKVVYSEEPPLTPIRSDPDAAPEDPGRRSVPGSVAFVPSVAGLILAGEVIKDLCGLSEAVIPS